MTEEKIILYIKKIDLQCLFIICPVCGLHGSQNCGVVSFKTSDILPVKDRVNYQQYSLWFPRLYVWQITIIPHQSSRKTCASQYILHAWLSISMVVTCNLVSDILPQNYVLTWLLSLIFWMKFGACRSLQNAHNHIVKDASVHIFWPRYTYSDHNVHSFFVLLLGTTNSLVTRLHANSFDIIQILTNGTSWRNQQEVKIVQFLNSQFREFEN